jgi:anaerobic magnesium-protoporphyrin IX monomethyl ester cyclase
LGLTFSHGDYARLLMQPVPQQVAFDLFQRALRICPDQRAYWGINLILQRQGEWELADRLLDQGLTHLADNLQMHIGKAYIHMHAGRFSEALEYLLPCETSQEALPYIAQCYRELGDTETAGRFAMRLKHTG